MKKLIEGLHVSIIKGIRVRLGLQTQSLKYVSLSTPVEYGMRINYKASFIQSNEWFTL